MRSVNVNTNKENNRFQTNLIYNYKLLLLLTDDTPVQTCIHI